MLLGWGATFPLMGPIVRSAVHGWYLRFPMAMTFTTFFALQGANWYRPSKEFHELMCQPAPHGGYLRRTVAEHFPVWWKQVSADLHDNGYSLPEMNEYDKRTEFPRHESRFDASIL